MNKSSHFKASLQANRANTPALFHVVSGVWGLRTAFANLYLVRNPDAPADPWVLVDAGVPGYSDRLLHSAENLFGSNNPPAAIVLTHGHFDHVGTLPQLLAAWPGVPVYAHPLELPYLTGRSSYPPPDPSVGGGAMSAMSFLYPKKPLDLGQRVQALPEDGSVPHLPGWRWVRTPGHSPGHVSLFREQDRILLAGDAFVTVQAESGLATLTQQQEISGPPAYFTTDWPNAARSVALLAELQPAVAATGHGIPMRGDALQQQLSELAEKFEELAVPRHGRYVPQPATADETGVTYLPPAVAPRVPLWLVGAVLAGGVYWLRSRRQEASSRPAPTGTTGYRRSKIERKA